MHRTNPFTLLTAQLSLFGEPAAAPAAAEAAAGEASGVPAASADASSREGTRNAGARSAFAAPEPRYGRQPGQTAAPQQTPAPAAPQAPDKGRRFRELIRGEFKDQYAEETQRMLNRRFRETDERLRAMQPIIDLLDRRYGAGGDMAKLMSAVEADRAAQEQAAAERAGMTPQQARAMQAQAAADGQRMTPEQARIAQEHAATARAGMTSQQARAMQDQAAELAGMTPQQARAMQAQAVADGQRLTPQQAYAMQDQTAADRQPRPAPDPAADGQRTPDPRRIAEQHTHAMARAQVRRWQAEAEALREKYPDFDLAAASRNGMFRYLLRSGDYPMEAAYRAAFADALAARAATNAQKAVTDHIRARGSRPQEAGAAATPAFTAREDVSKLSDEDVRRVLAQISNGRKVTFG